MSFGFGSTGFGTPAAQTTLSFGAQQNQPATGGFGTQATQPATGGFGMQATQPATGGFGTPAQTGGYSFGGTPAASATPSLFGTSQPAQTTSALSFGTPQAAATAAPTNTGFSFGTPAASAAPAFGATPQPSGFGATAATPAPAFGATATPAATTAQTGFGLGGAATGSLTFGTPASQAQAQPKLGLSFGAASTAATTSAPSAFSFGTAASSAPAATTTTGFSLGATTTAPTLGLSFGTPATTATTSLGGFGTSLGGGLNFGFGSSTSAAAPTTAPPAFGFGTSTATSAAPTTTAVGLGGIASTTISSTAASAKTETAPKEQPLPNEIQQTVDSFKNFVKQQKSYSSDVARCSVKEFRKVEADIDTISNLLNEVQKQLQLNRNIAEKLKYDTAIGLQQVEMAQRTYDTPIGLQYENTAPLRYFVELADQFEREMQRMRIQIESTDRYIKDHGKTTPLTHQDLILGMRRIHEIFVSLAGHLQSLHTQVDAQKEQYINFRKYILNDPTNIFESSSKNTENTINQIKNFSLRQPPALASGPTPFGNVTHPSVVQAAALSNPTPAPAFPSSNMFNTGSFGSGFQSSNTFGTGGSSFGGFGLGTSSNFQLQKPPTGNKRGKQ